MKKFFLASALCLISATASAQQTDVSSLYGIGGGATQALSAKAVTISTTGDQGTITVPSYITKYSVSTFVVTNCSGTPLAAQVAMYTGAGATGTNVVAAGTITGATSSTVMVLPTVTAATTALTSSSLFVRITVQNVAAITCDFYAIVNNLS